MNPLQLAQQYMDAVFTTGDIRALRDILAEDCQFHGPFNDFDTADAYINALLADPPAEFGYELIKAYEDDSSACLVYRFFKPGVSTIMVQVFETANGKISRILLVFNSLEVNG